MIRGVKPFERPSSSIGQWDNSLWQLFGCCWDDCPLVRPSIVEVVTAIDEMWFSMEGTLIPTMTKYSTR
jgi:hypothetical protein